MNLQYKIDVLEKEDQILRKYINDNNLPIYAACNDMCPEKERYLRQIRKQVSIFETENFEAAFFGNKKSDYILDPYKAIKQYSRSAADQDQPLPTEIRTIVTLDYTINYLVTNIMGNEVCLLHSNLYGDYYNFIWSRTRAIRKDIVQQLNSENENEYSQKLIAISILEKCVRWHIFCGYYFCQASPDIFDAKLNDEHLTKCLHALRQYYSDLHSYSNIIITNESEFQAYFILLNFDLKHGDVISNISNMPLELLSSKPVLLALDLFKNFHLGNYDRFFKLIKRASFLTCCIIHRYLYRFRLVSMEKIIFAYRGLPLTNDSKIRKFVLFPTQWLSHLLFFDDIPYTQYFSQQNDFIQESLYLCITNTDAILLQENDDESVPTLIERLFERETFFDTFILPDKIYKVAGYIYGSEVIPTLPPHIPTDSFREPEKNIIVDSFDEQIPAEEYINTNDTKTLIDTSFLINNLIKELLDEFICEIIPPLIKPKRHKSFNSKVVVESIYNSLVVEFCNQISRHVMLEYRAQQIYNELIDDIIYECLKRCLKKTNFAAIINYADSMDLNKYVKRKHKYRMTTNKINRKEDDAMPYFSVIKCLNINNPMLTKSRSLNSVIYHDKPCLLSMELSPCDNDDNRLNVIENYININAHISSCNITDTKIIQNYFEITSDETAPKESKFSINILNQKYYFTVFIQLDCDHKKCNNSHINLEIYPLLGLPPKQTISMDYIKASKKTFVWHLQNILAVTSSPRPNNLLFNQIIFSCLAERHYEKFRYIHAHIILNAFISKILKCLYAHIQYHCCYNNEKDDDTTLTTHFDWKPSTLVRFVNLIWDSFIQKLFFLLKNQTSPMPPHLAYLTLRINNDSFQTILSTLQNVKIGDYGQLLDQVKCFDDLSIISEFINQNVIFFSVMSEFKNYPTHNWGQIFYTYLEKVLRYLINEIMVSFIFCTQDNDLSVDFETPNIPSPDILHI